MSNTNKLSPEELVKRNPDHVMMFMQNNMNNVMELDGSAIKLLLYLVDLSFQGHPNMTLRAYCVPPLSDIAKFTGFSKKTIIEMTKQLVDKGWIKVFKSGNTNVYAINPYRFWKSGDDDKWNALFLKDPKKLERVVVRGNIVITGESKTTRKGLSIEVLDSIEDMKL